MAPAPDEAEFARRRSVGENDQTSGPPAISVIVPVHDSAAFLEPLLASLLAQTEASLEVIAIDDGSTDGSLQILHAAAAGDPRLRVLATAHGGVSAARNLGLAEARGTWIGFADSDDRLDPRTLATWRAEGERTGAEAVLGNGRRFSDEPDPSRRATSHLVRYPMPPGVFSGAQWIEHCVARADWAHYVWLQLIRREVLARTGLRFEEGIVHEDVLWSMQLGLRLQRMVFVPEPLYGYRIHPASLTHNPAVAALHDRARGYLVVMRRFSDAAAATATAGAPETNTRGQPKRLRRAFLRHAQREGRNLFTLMRAGVLTASMRGTLAREFLQLGLLAVMFRGAENPTTAWRAVRCWRLMRRCARL